MIPTTNVTITSLCSKDRKGKLIRIWSTIGLVWAKELR